MNQRLHLRRPRASTWLFATLSWIPMFLSAPGKVAADTKQFLYLDPRWLLGRASSLWDASAGLGTVTHQNIGYLWPMGPWFAACDALGIPMWIAQRVWLGALLFVAACGVRWMCRQFSLTGPSVVAAALLYALGPYQLAYMGRTSVILLPWAGLPWLIGLAVQAGRTGKWRQPALFALAVVTIGAINASSLLYIGLAPVLWFPFAVWIARELPWRRALAAMARIGACTVPVQLWWMAGLRTQAAYGLPILQLTETLETVATTATSSELLRGLGYWYFYGKDTTYQWTDAVNWYTQNPAVIVLSFLLPALGVLAAVSTRWRYRTYFIGLTVIGLVLAVGSHPYDDPAPFGSFVKAASNAGTAAFAMRNSPRAVPLLALSLSVLTGVGLSALGRWLTCWRSGRHSALGPAAVGAICVLAIVNLPPLWTGAMVQPQLQRSESLPDYWTQATSALDAAGNSTRVLEIPGQDFGAYRWGTTQDVITRGLMDRPWVGRELIPFGSPPSADLLRALDRRVQEGTLDPAAIAPIARLMTAGTVLLRTDAAYERYVTPRPRVLQQLLTPTPDGLSDPVTYGPPEPNRAVARQPLVDETELSTDPATAWPAPLAAYAVDDAVPIVHAERADAAVVFVGNGEGLVDAAEAGLTALEDIGSVPIVSAAALDGITVPAASSIVLTDSNRRRAERWGTLRENYGYTETAGEQPLVDDPKDTRLDVFPGSTDADRSVTVFSGNIASVRASRYGNPVSYSPEDRPANALDGDLRTGWRTGAFEKVGGERWRVDLTRAITTDHVTLVQPGGNRFITSVTVQLSDGSSTHVGLGDESFADSGQRIDLGSHTFTWMEIRIDSANIGRRADYLGLSTVGFREVRIDGVGPSDERVQLPAVPTSLDASGSVDVVLSRLRANPSEAFKSDTETHLSRRFTTPAGDYSLTGSVRLDAAVSDATIDAIIGRAATGSAPRPTATSSDRLAGMRTATAAAAFDGDPSTFWSAGFGPQAGRWIELDAAAPTTVARLQLTVLADGRHSVPSELKVSGDGGEPIVVPVPEIADGIDENHPVSVDVALTSPITATRFRIEISAVRSLTTKDFLSAGQVEMPVALAEVDLGGVEVPAPLDHIDTGCRNDLLSIAGSPVSVSIRGATADALAGRQLTLTSCQGPLQLADEAVDLTAAPGIDTGFDIDRVVLHRDATGPTPPSNQAVPTVPTVSVTGDGQHSFDLSVTNQAGGAPFWLVLGQSRSDGWHLKINGHDLGTPRLVDGYANGWLVDPSKVFDGGTAAKASLDWTPQQLVDLAMWFSALAVAVCVGLIVLNPGRAVAIDTCAPPPIGRSLLRRRPGRAARPNATRVAQVVAGATLVAWLMGGLVVAVPIAVVTALAMATRWGALAVSVPPWAFFGPIGLATAAAQVVVSPRPGVEWPDNFNPSHQIMLFAVACLVADTLVGWSLRSQR